jgi:sporulation protein YlmC with PRC-barrel domain
MRVFTSDDRDIGTVDRLILDPDLGAVKAAVVRKGVLLHRDVEVPIEVMSAGSAGGARIAYSSEEIERLPHFNEAGYTRPPADYMSPTGYPSSSVYWPAGYGMGVPPLDPQPPASPIAPHWSIDTEIDREVGDALRQQDLENAVIGEGSDVLGRDGKKVGTVRELTFDPANSKLTSLVVHKGFIIGKDTELPATLVDSVDDGVVYLNVDARACYGLIVSSGAARCNSKQTKATKW